MEKTELIDLARQLDLRVGRICLVDKHPNADSLYIEEVDLGTEQKTVVSGLVNYLPQDALKNRLCVFVNNMKPTMIRGHKSQAMILVAKDGDSIELLEPPKDSVPGDRVIFDDKNIEPGMLNPKKKVFEKIQPYLQVKDNIMVLGDAYPFYVENKGSVITRTIVNGSIS